jgi:hypothetical protein
MELKKIYRTLVLLIIIIPFLPVTPAQDMTIVILSNVELVTVDESYATITWTTNIPSDTQIQWGLTDQLGEDTIIEESVTYHIAKLSNLKQNTTYYFRVGSGGRWSDISTFTTLAPAGGVLKLKFAFASDMHYDLDGRNTPNGFMYGESTRLVRSLVDQLNTDTTLDFVVTGGDLTNGAEEDYPNFVDEMDKLKVPWYPVLGNHDKTFAGWSEWYNDTMERTQTYFSFNQGGYHLVILDTASQGQVTGELDDTQLAWLETDLDANTDRPTLLFMHHMTDRTDINGITEESKAMLDAILESRSNVLSLTAGHIHENYASGTENLPMYVSVGAVVSYPIGYSIIKLYDKGYTQSFHKIESELETSEESRIRLSAATGTSEEEALGDLEDRSFRLDIPQNQAPSISSVVIDPNPVSVDSSATIAVSASDPEGDQLTYFYEVTGGLIEGSGSRVIYNPPAFPGVYVLTVKVSDGTYYSSEKVLEIIVEEVTIPPVLNHAPVLNKATSSSTSVTIGERVTLEVTASDKDNDFLTYHYEASAGTIIGSGKKVDWQAPDYKGTFTISIWVSDGEMESSKKTITITVGGSSDDGTDNGSVIPGFNGGILIPVLVLIVFCLFLNRHGKKPK